MSKAHVWQSGSLQECVRWRSEDGSGLEHLDITSNAHGIAVDGIIIGDRFSAAYGTAYQIRCAPDWTIRHVHIRVIGGGTLELFTDGKGNWSDGQGRELSHLAGCIDIDISATPFTNTLPIRRLALAQDERRLIRVAYLSVPTLKTTAADQAYTCLELGRLYRYEGLFRNFTTDLEVDCNGIVLDYPSLFRRIRAD